MIQEIKIQNFLSFKDEVTFSFEATTDTTLSDHYIIDSIPGVKLLKMAMVYGANASGKSNLINAVHFLRNLIFNAVDNKEEEINFHAFDSIQQKRAWKI
jgi:AAA15 family ATPase/GTPase